MLSPMFATLLLAFLAGGCGPEQPFPERSGKRVALTFDDAPVMHFYSHPSQWHRKVVIDSLTLALARHETSATIFTVGSMVEHPEGEELLRYWLDSGVQLAHHSMHHRSFNTLSPDEACASCRSARASSGERVLKLR